VTDYTIPATGVRPLEGSVTSHKDAAEAMNVGDWVYVNGSGNAALADGSATETANAQLGQVVAGSRALASGAIASGERVTIVWFGRVAYADSVALDETKHVYLSDTAGKCADAPGTIIRRLGSPEASNILFINPATVTSASI
jgi:hypothetical protein